MPFPSPHPPVPRRRGCRYMSLSCRIRACLQYKPHSRYKHLCPSKRLSPSVQMYSIHMQNRSSLGAQAGFQVHSLRGRLAHHHSSHHLRRMFPSCLWRSVIAVCPRLASPSTLVLLRLSPIRSHLRYHPTYPSSRSRSSPRPHPHNPRPHHLPPWM